VPELCNPKPFSQENLARLVKWVPVKDQDGLHFYWVLPYSQKDIKAEPLSYFTHLIGHEGENSLLSYLKSEGLATKLFAGKDHDLWGFTVLEVSINLTKAGFE
jgi:insulysin